MKRKNKELSALCQKQAEEIAELELRVHALENKEAANLTDRCEMQEQQLDELQQNLANKSRELREAQAKMLGLERDLRSQTGLSERYQSEVEDLEQRLRDLTEQKQRAEDKVSIAEWHLKSSGPRQSKSRRTSHKGAMAWCDGGEEDDPSMASTRPSTRPSTTMACSQSGGTGFFSPRHNSAAQQERCEELEDIRPRSAWRFQQLHEASDSTDEDEESYESATPEVWVRPPTASMRAVF